jgi:hypothetical protein
MMRTYPSKFERSALPPARSFYESELGKLSRPDHKGWARTSCPFHGGNNRSAFVVNLETGGFYCFNCAAKGGDIVSFVMQRDNVNFRRAAESFGAWRSEIEPAELSRLRQAQHEHERQRAEQEARKESERRQRINARDWLHTAEKLYDEAIRKHDWDLMPLLSSEVRQAEEAYWQAAGFEVRHER